MNIDREYLERELSNARLQKAQSESIHNQACGAERVLLAALAYMDMPEPETADDEQRDDAKKG